MTRLAGASLAAHEHREMDNGNGRSNGLNRRSQASCDVPLTRKPRVDHRSHAFAILAIPMLLAATPAARLDSAWYGDWTLDRGRSQFMAPVLTIGRTLRGYHFDFGATSFDIGDDGRDYPTVPTRTTSLQPTAPGSWFRVHKVDGHVIDQSRLRVTADQRELIIDTTATDAAGTVRTFTERQQRVGRGQGLAGTWRSKTLGANVTTEIVLCGRPGGTVGRSYPREGQSYSAAPNGPPAPYLGPRAVPGVTVALGVLSRTKLRWTESIGVKPYTVAIDVLSPDGQRLTETSWPAARPSERQVAVYERRSGLSLETWLP